MDSTLETIKALPELAKAVYSDAASKTLQEVGKIGVDAVKTIRLALFPLQISAALQDRLAAYIDKAIRAVPQEQRIAPQQSLVLSTCEHLKLCDETEAVSHLYVNLLSRAMDRERVGEAHPAFINIISQLAPDELLVMRQLGEAKIVGNDGVFKILFRKLDESKDILNKESATTTVSTSKLRPEMKELIVSICIEPEELAQPYLYATFLEHLVSLGIVSYTNEPMNYGILKEVGYNSTGAQMLCIQLSKFGTLFYKACVRDALHIDG
jgi:hypothetical protein